MPDYMVIATWTFGTTAAKAAAELLQKGKPALDAVIAGAQAVEDGASFHSVGYGGLPNAIGTVQLDACVMDGQTLACGGVAALENVRHPAALARRVMEKTPHVLLVGAGAQLFAVQQGFQLENLSTPDSLKEWEKTRPRDKVKGKAEPWEQTASSDNHDTVTVLALDQKGSLGGVCTTTNCSGRRTGNERRKS